MRQLMLLLCSKCVTKHHNQFLTVVCHGVELCSPILNADLQTQQAVDSGAVDGFVAILRESTEQLERKEALWSLSNVAGGNRVQIQAVLDSGAVALALATLAEQESVPAVLQVRRRLVWASVLHRRLCPDDSPPSLLDDVGIVERVNVCVSSVSSTASSALVCL